MVRRKTSSRRCKVLYGVLAALLTGPLLILTTQQVCVTCYMLRLKPHRGGDNLLFTLLFFFYILMNIIVARLLWSVISNLHRLWKRSSRYSNKTLMYTVCEPNCTCTVCEPKRTRSGKIYGYRCVVCTR